ncbi:MAG: response regulator [Ferruginibacter sp.]|nr:response regulator [Ferruginibacter sp.]
MKVLIVDDSLLITVRLKEMVKEIGCVSDVFVCTNYADAIALLQEVKPQIILLDIHLDKDSGLDILGHVCTNHPTIKVIMVTNKASKYYRNLCKKMGSHGFVDKSEEFEKLPSIIEGYY